MEQPTQMLVKGEAPVKKEYLISHKRSREEDESKTEPKNENTEDDVISTDDTTETTTNQAHKKRRMDEKKKQRKDLYKLDLCKNIILGQECPYGDKCKFPHDVKTFMDNKPPDISNNCYVFSLTGRCPFGLACRFASAHTKDNKPIVNEEVARNYKPVAVQNILSREQQADLRKKKLRDFPKTKELMAKLQEEKKKRGPDNDEGEPYIETPLKPNEKKKLDLKDKLYLAPLTTLGNLPFRRICKQFGADITCGEMALATNLLQGSSSEWALLKRHPSEDFFGVQLCGSNADVLTQCAELLDSSITTDFIDLNCGCPIDLIYNKGAGSALLERKRRLWDICWNMNQATSVPLTIKVRIGKDESKPTLHKWISGVENLGVSAITIHGRSRTQRYSKEANWDYINQCAKLTNLPVIGNGDIFSYEDYLQHMENSNLATVMIARGAIIKPWIFTEIKERRHWDISSRERLEFIQRFINYGLEHWGSDHQGVEKTRTFFLEWQSFLHRYIPVGLLEVLPAKINMRAPRFFGRDDMETLLSSPESKDWVKLSEMFLGPVKSDYHFVPKHKSHATCNG